MSSKVFCGVKKRVGKAVQCCASGFPECQAQLPTTNIAVKGKIVTALVDTGCTRSIISSELVRADNLRRGSERIVTMNGSIVVCESFADVRMQLNDVFWQQSCLTYSTLPGFEMLLGMDVVNRMGGVKIANGDVCFPFSNAVSCAAVDLRIDDPDFSAFFEDGKWVIRWKWDSKANCSATSDDVAVPTLRNQIPQYPPSEAAREPFEQEVETWIENGWLIPYDGPYEGVVPLMAVIQRNKNKVRPVLDYREVNEFLSCHTAESVACNESLRIWRRMGTNISLIDLKKAYLQLHVHPDLWKFQVVRYKGRTFCMTRLGFGLSVPPKIMSCVLRKILSLDRKVAAATESYIDDIAVNNDVVSNEEVLQLLGTYGLEAKEPEFLDGARVLGLKVSKGEGGCRWCRDNAVDEIKPCMSRREVFSWCGQLVGHLPVANWLRPACSFLKRLCSHVSWDDPAPEKAMLIVQEIHKRFKASDPACGRWDVPKSDHGVLWCDASSLAIGACLEVDGHVIEDGSWLRKRNDAAHINLAELEAVLKGISMALAWGLKEVELKVDSMSVFSWIQSLLSGMRRIRVKGMSEALVRRRLSLLNDTINECNLNLTVTFVPSQVNRADILTRVPQAWLRECMSCVAKVVEGVTLDEVKRIHSLHHFGVDRTLFFVNQLHPGSCTRRKTVEKVIESCVRCKSIDPSAEKWSRGELCVRDVWARLACDVTHFGGERYLTVIDSGPSRFAIWRHLRTETAGEVAGIFEEIFREHGVPSEVLCDNGPCFRSQVFAEVLRKWGVTLLFRCAYRPSGNGIAERSHRTIKRMAARSGGNVLDMVRFYNAAPLRGTDADSCPCNQKFAYRWTLFSAAAEPSTGSHRYFVGQRVFVKPPGARCTSQWKGGVVTGVPSQRSVEVGGVPWHIADVRPVPSEGSDSSDSEATLPMEEEERQERRPRRRRAPRHFDDYVVDFSDHEIMGECDL